jgi:uncharacterized protein YraI
MQQATASRVVFPVVGTVLKNANVRSGPGTTFPIISHAKAGEHLNVLGCNGDCSWYQLAEDCWIAAFLVQPEQPIVSPALTPLVTPLPPNGVIPLPTVVLAVPITTTPGITGVPTIVVSIPVTPTPTVFVQITKCPQTVAPTTTYAGPGEFYGPVDSRPAGECVAVIGRNAAGDWYQLAHGMWMRSEAVIYGDPPETIPVTDQPYTPTPVLPATPYVTPTLVIIATPVPTATADLSEITTVGEWMAASQARKEATTIIWTERYLANGTITDDSGDFAGRLLTCMDNTLVGTAEILGANYPAQTVADGCASTLK